MASNDKLHIVMFPWLAFGHLNPYLELAKLIAQKGHHVSFLSTPKNIDRLAKPPTNLATLINFVKLPLPQVSNLPLDVEGPADLPYNVVQYLKLAYDGLKELVTHFLKSSDVDWVLYDYAPYWIAPIASKLGIKTAYFSLITATSLGFLGPPSILTGEEIVRSKVEDFIVSPKWVPFPNNVRFRYYEIMQNIDTFINIDSAVSDQYRFGQSIKSADIVAVRSSNDFEPEWLQLLETIYQKPVLPVGHLPPNLVQENGEENGTWQSIKEWLDKHPKGSVVYVAFGSELKVSQEELTKIALGLEKSDLPFFWVLKTHRGLYDIEIIKLPEGFEERTKGQGLVWTSWAPQLKILGHESVGGFFSHAGCSSMVEGIVYEKALVLFSFVTDQGLNSRVLEEKKLGYPVPRNEQDGSFTSEEVAESLRLVMVKEEGREYRENVKEMKGLFVGKQEEYLDNFLAYLKTNTLLRSANSNTN